MFPAQIYRKVIAMFSGYNDILSVKDLCEALHIGKNTAYRLLRSKEIKSIKIGKVYKIPKEYVSNYIKQKIDK